MIKVVKVWICPSPDCRNYFASSSAGDLSILLNNHAITKQPTFTRDRCPDCWVRERKEVKRIPKLIQITVEDESTTTTSTESN